MKGGVEKKETEKPLSSFTPDLSNSKCIGEFIHQKQLKTFLKKAKADIYIYLIFLF